MSANAENEAASAFMTLTPDVDPVPESAEVSTFGAGCFWCVEEVFHQTPGILSSVSGYMGGSAETANYEEVCSGRTEHAEVVQVFFDPDVISYSEVLDQFFKLHDPTTINRQGNDRGTQYRSAIFYHDDLQKLAAEKKIQELTASKEFSGDIVTEVTEAPTFYEAEEYHQNFARHNPGNGYLTNVLYPKLKKLHLKIPAGEGSGEQPKGSALKGSSLKGSGPKP